MHKRVLWCLDKAGNIPMEPPPVQTRGFFISQFVFVTLTPTTTGTSMRFIRTLHAARRQMVSCMPDAVPRLITMTQ